MVRWNIATGPWFFTGTDAKLSRKTLENRYQSLIERRTRILESIEHGDPKAADRLLPLVYGELRKLAASKMANELPNQTLQPTALVHEAWLRLVGNTNPNFSGKAHFFGAAAEAMRRILIEKAHRKHANRHGGN